MTRLVLVHGRDLDGRDREALESQWLGALGAGLAAAGSALRPTDDDASFVYYGDTLERLVDGGAAPPVTVHALASDPAALPRLVGALPDGELRFVLDVVREVLATAGHRPGVAPPAAAESVVAEGVVGDALVEALVGALALVDRYVPGVSAAVLLTLTRDVYAYLHDDAVRRVIDAGLADALTGATSGEPAVVVAHSLGSVVAYSVLAGRASGPEVPLLLTPGSPLGIRAVREVLAARAPLVFPAGVGRWVSPRDPRDLLALHDLTPDVFPLPAGSPGIEARRVTNRAPGFHAAAYPLDDGAWAGYLALPEVAGPVGEALT
ncbi:hypothetical protein [Isoptericola sp. NPDC019482]|uniref:hypothetical protein n=1 Tax=Isoptericola sp. NPDC019482 TaxID=3154688 RepID=UPI00348684CF